MFFPTSMISLMVSFRTFSFLDFLADLSPKNPSQLPVICSPVVCLVTMFLPHIMCRFHFILNHESLKQETPKSKSDKQKYPKHSTHSHMNAGLQAIRGSLYIYIGNILLTND
jgi:hypothetical protein